MLCVLKLSEGLDEKPTVQFHGSDGLIGDSYKSYLTHREILERFLKAFRAQDPQNCPTILVIGTHKDQQQKLDLCELDKFLQNFKEEVIQFGDHCIAMLSCTSDKNEDQKKVEDIREALVTKGTNIEETPMAWFGLELALKKASQSENSKPKGIMSLEQCKLEANKLPYFKTRSGQFNAALKHFVKHNIFLYYKDALPDVVFCDPKVLLTMVTEIVKHHYEVKQGKRAVKGTKFKDYCYVSATILDCILSQYYNDIFSSKSFLNLLSDLKVVAAVNTNGDHLMPALLQNATHPATKVGEIDRKKRLPPLCIRFDEGCAPSGVFCSLVTTLLQPGKWELWKKNGKPFCCFRNCITFTYQMTVITLVDYFSHFSIYMYIPIQSKDKDMPLKIKDEIHNSITTIAERLQYSNLTFQDAIECPECKHTEVALWNLENQYKCTVDDVHTGPIPEAYQIWMKTAGMWKV